MRNDPPNASISDIRHLHVIPMTAPFESPAPLEQPALLSRYACDPRASRGRRLPQPPAEDRNDFQRDRDRIVHSTAFRRLVYKTQVFLNHEGDLFRTRLTHSLEVAQLARAIARRLSLHEDLIEAIALAHDLGHTPFGHAGQDALDDCLRRAEPDGLGFEHNFQSLRVVDELEERYPDFNGLNLCFETREGILKHCSMRRAAIIEAGEPGGVGRRFMDGTRPSLEAQVCNIADEIAYNAHDIDDGVRSGLLTHDQLMQVAVFARHSRAVLVDHPRLTGRRQLFEVVRRILSEQVHDVVETTRSAIERAGPRSVDDVRGAVTLASFTPQTLAETRELKAFLRTHLYRHPNVVEQTEHAKQVVRDLFDAYLADPKIAPIDRSRDTSLPRAVADYLAGMTDRFAMREHARLIGAIG